MSNLTEREKNRRLFLKYLAASPLLGMGAKGALAATGAELQERPADPYIWFPSDPNYVPEKPEDTLDLFEMESACHKKVPPAHFASVSSAADDDGGQIANRRAIANVALRGHRARDVSHVDTSIELFGAKYTFPFFLCPTGVEKSFDPEGVIAALRASGRHNVGQILSTVASATVADANKARNSTPVMHQLYHGVLSPVGNFEVTKAVMQRAEREGAKVVCVTVDGPSSRKTMQVERARRADTRLCAQCHEIRDPKRPKNVGRAAEPPQFSEIPKELQAQKPADPLTWELIKRLRDNTKMNMFLKGIMNPQDAAMCVKYGYGVYISNHGGRNEDTTAGTLSALPDIVSVVKGKVPIFIDGGFRRGMDIVKALAMGATMVGFGRPWLWGLGAFGEAGVDRVIQIVKAEVVAAMQQVGAANLKELGPDIVFKP